MASKTIKGLTVEIGGDTTKLGKALKDVEAKSRDLTRELKDIDRLLKLDPGNTELLAQKQKVLADAAEAAAEKLETLKEAEAQVQEQFEKGEVSEEQLRALQREIIATENRMKACQKAAEQAAKAIEDLGDSADRAGDEMEDTGDGADDTSKDIDKYADAAEDADEASSHLGSKLSRVLRKGFVAVGAAATAAVGALVGSAEATREYRTAMGKLDTAFTTSGHKSEAATKTYKTLQGVLGDSDQAVEASNHLAKLCDNEDQLAKMTEAATGVYAVFGDSLPIENLTEASNETAKTGQITGGLADALNWALNGAGVSEEDFQEKLDKCSGEQERQALIIDTLNGLYSDAAGKYRETNAEVIRANEANEAWTSTMAEVGESIEPILTDVKLLGASLLSDFLPGVQGAAEAVRGLLNGEDGAADALGEALGGIITQLLDKVVELAPTLVQVAMSLITSLTTTLISMLPQLLEACIQIIGHVLEGLSVAVPQILQAIVDLLPLLVQALTGGIPLIIRGAIQLLLAIVQAIPQIIPPLIAAIPQIVSSVVECLISSLPVLLDGAIQLFMALVQALPTVVVELAKAVPQLVLGIAQGIINGVPVAVDALLSLGKKLLDAFLSFFGIHSPSTVFADIGKNLIAGLVNGVKNIGTALWKAISGAVTKVAEWGRNLVAKAKDAGSKFLSGVVSFFKQLPGKIWSFLTNAVQKIVQFGSNALQKAKEAGKKILNGIINVVTFLPKKIKQIGKDLVSGLWNGITDKLTWLKNKIKSFTNSVLDSIKGFFGVNSPSKETDWIGEMLDQGLAKGVLDNMDRPLDAMHQLSDGMLDEAGELNGMTLERRLHHSYSAQAATADTMGAGMLDKLDKILTAIERGQVLTIDRKALIGATAADYDNTLGQRRALAARGAL